MTAVKTSTRKSLRDLRRQRAQVIAVAITITLGVAIYIAAGGAFQNLTASYNETYDRLHFADLVAEGGDAEAVAQASRKGGAEQVETRIQTDQPMLIKETKLLGRVISIPTGAHPAINDVDVIEGEYLDAGAQDQVLVETHAAQTFSLKPGDTIQVYSLTGWQTVTVKGIVDSPEYLWPARSRQEVISDPYSFAVIFAPPDAVAAWYAIAPNQTLALMPSDSGEGERDAVENAMRDAGASSVTPWEDQASNATLSEDLQGFDQMSVAFPFMFLSAAAIAAYVMLARRIVQEKPVIGTLMAAGARRRAVLWHYVNQGTMIGAIGAVAGVVLGAAMNSSLTRWYTSFVGVPDTVIRNYPSMIATGLAVGIVVGALGALGPAITASRTAPAAAMRSAPPASTPGRWAALVARLHWLSASSRMALRDVVRNPRRTLATMLGTILALVLVLASVGMMTSMMQAISIHYQQVQLEDAIIGAQAGTVTQEQLEGISGVTLVEPVATGQVTVLHGRDSYATALYGFTPDTQMHGFRGVDGETVTLPDDGMLAGSALADVLGVSVGDVVTLRTDAGERAITIAGFLDEPLGTVVYTEIDTARNVLPDEGVDTFAVQYADDADRDALRQEVTQIDGVVLYQDARAIVGMIDDFLGLFWAFIGAMIVLGGVLALAVMYVTMAVNVVERTGELATLRAAGAPVRKVAGAIATENLLATVLAIPLGLWLGAIAAQRLLASFSSDLFTLELRWQWWVLPATALVVIVAALVSQWPTARAVKRVDVAVVVRERAV